MKRVVFGIASDETYFYVNTGGKQVERYTHSGQFVDIFISHSEIISAGFSSDYSFSTCDITVAGDELIVTGGPGFHKDNIARFNKNTGDFIAKWDTVPCYPYGICWVPSLSTDSFSCNAPEGCVVVSQFGTSDNGGQSGNGPLHVYSPDGTTYYGCLPTTGNERQAGLDYGYKDSQNNSHDLVLFHGFFGTPKVAELVFN